MSVDDAVGSCSLGVRMQLTRTPADTHQNRTPDVAQVRSIVNDGVRRKEGGMDPRLLPSSESILFTLSGHPEGGAAAEGSRLRGCGFAKLIESRA